MINLFNKKQKPKEKTETKPAFSLDDLKFIALNHQDQNVKDKAGKMIVNNETYLAERGHDILNDIASNNDYSIKTRILAGEKYIEYRLSCPSFEKNELLKISACNQYTEDNRKKAGIEYLRSCIQDGNYSKLSEISKNSSYPLEVRDYAQNNFNLAIEKCINNYINDKLERIKQGNFTFLLYFGENEYISENLRTKVEERVKIAVETKLKSGCKNIDPNYFFKLTEHKYISESLKNWAKKQGTEIAREEVNAFYSQGDYRNLTNYCNWTWVPQEVQELSKKKLEELVVEMGKRL